MTRFTVESALGDVLDRITILQIKRDRIDAPRRPNVEAELSALLAAWTEAALPAPEGIPEYPALKAVNEALWTIEDDLRALEARQEFGPEFVDLARSVYQTNDRRASLKRAVNDRLGSALREEKVHPRYGIPHAAVPGAATSLTHLDPSGNARMVEVGEKDVTRRSATAEGRLTLGPVALSAIRERSAKKGDVLTIAQIAGIQAAKRTGELIPLCHPLPLDGVDLSLALARDATHGEHVHIVATVRCTGRTGVEMEALTAVTVAGLTVYDMLKAVDRGMVMHGVRLLQKSGGRSGEWRADILPKATP